MLVTVNLFQICNVFTEVASKADPGIYDNILLLITLMVLCPMCPTADLILKIFVFCFSNDGVIFMYCFFCLFASC